MSQISQLEPREFFGYFEELSRIPRPSGHEEAVGRWLVEFAKEHGLEHYRDSLGNVIIIREADPGQEDRDPIILQGHMDMVCEKEPDCTKDMEKEGLDLDINGDFLFAKGTSLGADDGEAICFSLSFLSRDKASFPRLECVFTVSEETGMEGAEGIDLSMLRGKRLINLDSEEEGIIITGCAGGAKAEISLPIQADNSVPDRLVDITISGLQGGHSGADIDKNRENAVILMGRLLDAVMGEAGGEPGKLVDIRLLSLRGGNKDNAIPRECRASFSVREEDVVVVTERLKSLASELQREFEQTEPDLRFSFALSKVVPLKALNPESSRKCLSLISHIPNGLQKMGDEIPETSLNLGVCSLEVDEGRLSLLYSLRSQKAAELDNLKKKVSAICEGCGADLVFSGQYSPWEPVPSSPLQQLLKDVYSGYAGGELRFTPIHAGVECGKLSEKIPGLDAVSMGADLFDIHTTRERMSISSVRRVYGFLERVLEKC